MAPTFFERRIAMNCTLCPRNCNVPRDESVGRCGVGNQMRIARIAPHYWEEPCISGTKGSGTVFFCGCNLGCVYCQNQKISGGGSIGITYTPSQLAVELEKLQGEVHNINLVTPSHYVHQIAQMLKNFKPTLPIVYNCGGYEKISSLRLISDGVQIYLPDFKYQSPQLAEKLSGAPDYPSVAIDAIGFMLSQRKANLFDNDGIMTEGVIIRHLVLPGYTDESMKALKALRDNFGKDITLSIMSQYTPVAQLPSPLDRAVTLDEYELVLDYADFLGFSNGFRQEGGAVGESFIPPFNV